MLMEYMIYFTYYVNTLKNIKNMRDDVRLIVGVVNDKDATSYKENQ